MASGVETLWVPPDRPACQLCGAVEPDLDCRACRVVLAAEYAVRGYTEFDPPSPAPPSRVARVWAWLTDGWVLPVWFVLLCGLNLAAAIADGPGVVLANLWRVLQEFGHALASLWGAR